MDEIILSARGISITLSHIKVLDGVQFELRQGEIHSIVGEKDSGKTTLVKIIGGVYPSGTYEGRIFISGKEQKFYHVKDSEKAGIAILHQETPLVRQMNVCENIFLANEIAYSGIINWKMAFEETSKLLAKVGLNVPPATKITGLSSWEQLLVKTAKALSKRSKIIIFDEPTEELTELEGESFLQIIRDLKAAGYTIVFITHRLREVFDIADRITVLRNGKVICTEETENCDEDTILMRTLGREDSIESSEQHLKQYGITEREKEIILLLLKGYDNKKICGELFISLNTVKTHIYSIYQKTGVKNRMELACLAKGKKIGSSRSDISNISKER